MKVNCPYCGTRWNAGTKCRSCSRLIPELEYVVYSIDATCDCDDKMMAGSPLRKICINSNCGGDGVVTVGSPTSCMITADIKEEEQTEEE